MFSKDAIKSFEIPEIVKELVSQPGLKIYRGLDAYRQLVIREGDQVYSGDSAGAVAAKLRDIEKGEKEFCGFVAGRDNSGRELLAIPGIHWPESNQVILEMKDTAKAKVTRLFDQDNGAGGGLGKEVKSATELSPIIANEVDFYATVDDIKAILLREYADVRKEEIIREFARKHGIPLLKFRAERLSDRSGVVISKDFLSEADGAD